MMAGQDQDQKITQEAQNKAEKLKNEANVLFSNLKYVEAEEVYSQAISLNPLVPAYWSNRAFTNLKLENYGYAIRDAEEAVKLDPTFIKAYYRRASANMALCKYKDAQRDLKTVVKCVPNDADARSKLAAVDKIVRAADFAKALSYGYSAAQKSVIETLNIPSIIVEDSYDGMKWDDNADMSRDFLMDMIARFKSQKKLHKKYAYRIVVKVKEIFESNSSVVDIKIPADRNGQITVCGDVHGQFFDLLHIFELNGYPSESHGYLFNGDFVDRGSFSVEVILTLFAFKMLYPNSFFMSRGNHEADSMNKVYGFEGEVKHKYSELAMKLFSEVFNTIPLGNLIENRILVLHGGLFSRDDVSIQELRLMCEMLWSDPMPEKGRSLSKRGVGLQFGPDVTEKFLIYNNLDLLIRSHEVKQSGYVKEHDGKCITVFSAPNYCDSVGNEGAYINIKRKDPQDLSSDRPELDLEFEKFKAVPHPAVPAMFYSGPYSGMF